MKENATLIMFSLTFTGIPVAETKPVKMYFISLLILAAAVFEFYISTMVYRSYFLIEDVVYFSFPYESFILSWPLLLNLSFLTFMGGYAKKTQNINWFISNCFGVIAIFGLIFSLVFSFYVEYDLTSRGYVKCHKKSLHAPTEYVVSKDMCM